jgi:hypothetical protein
VENRFPALSVSVIIYSLKIFHLWWAECIAGVDKYADVVFIGKPIETATLRTAKELGDCQEDGG